MTKTLNITFTTVKLDYYTHGQGQLSCQRVAYFFRNFLDAKFWVSHNDCPWACILDHNDCPWACILDHNDCPWACILDRHDDSTVFHRACPSCLSGLKSEFLGYNAKMTRCSRDPGKIVRPRAIQNCPRNSSYADIFARVTREPGDFDIITQEFRFPTLYTNRTVIMDRHDEKQYCHRACPSCLSGLLTNRTGTMAYPNLTQKSFLRCPEGCIPLHEAFLGQIWEPCDRSGP